MENKRNSGRGQKSGGSGRPVRSADKSSRGAATGAGRGRQGAGPHKQSEGGYRTGGASAPRKRSTFTKGDSDRSFRSKDEQTERRSYKKEDSSKRFDEGDGYKRKSGPDSRKRAPFAKKDDDRKFRTSDEQPEKRFERNSRSAGTEKSRPYSSKREDASGKPKTKFRSTSEPKSDRKFYASDEQHERPYTKSTSRKTGFGKSPARKSSEKDYLNTKPSEDRFSKHKKFEEGEHPRHLKTFAKKSFQKFKKDKFEAKGLAEPDGTVRLNKYISNAGICSRREADQLISTGVIAVNGKVVTELGYKIGPDDTVQYGGESIRKEKLVYLLLNKPKDYITTMDDPLERKTILHLIRGACRERVYPVGRLDRASTGVLLLTNDGELTKRLTHPRYEKKKIYHVYLDKSLKSEDMNKIREGITLEDGEVKVDDISFVTGSTSKKEVGIELHSGKNRIIRRIFESLGYVVIKLDRVYFAGLTKKDLPRGKWRFLSEKEVNMLKMIG